MSVKSYVLSATLAGGLLGAASAPVFAQQAPPMEGDTVQLVAVLQNPDAPLFDKAKACQALAVVGTKEAVPALAALLADPQLAHYARFGLEPIPDPSVDAALREAMGRLKGGLLVGVIDSIGVRRDGAAVDGLMKLMSDADAQVAGAAAAALGRIATPEATAALKQALAGPAERRVAVADACLDCAKHLLEAGNQKEAVAIYDAVRGADVPEYIRIAALRSAICARGRDGLPLLAECLGSGDQAVFRAGLGAAHELGGAEVAELLVGRLHKPEPQAEPAKVLEITKAQYGADSRWVDVTGKLRAAVSNNTLSVEVSNGLAGDPAPSTVKELRVTYTFGGQTKTVVVPEKETLQIGEPVAEGDPRQVLLIYALGDLGQKAALPAVLEQARNGAWGARVAAIRVLARLGDASAVPALLSTAEGAGELGQAALDTLGQMEGEGVDEAIAAALEDSEGQRRAILIELVGQRAIQSAVPTLLAAADSPDEQVRLAAVKALGVTIGLDKLPVLIDRLLSPKSPQDAEAAKGALRTACLRTPDRNATAEKLFGAMPGASSEAKAALLELLGVVGGQKALEGVSEAARSGSEDVQDAATRVLGEWMSPDAAPVLLELANAGNEKFRVRCLRGYIRIPRQLDVPEAERVAMCRKALAAAQRDDEKKLVLEVLGRNPSAEALAVVVPLLASPGLKEPASEAAVAIAEEIVQSEPGPVAEAMPKVIEATGNEDLSKRARTLWRRAGGRPRR